MPDEPGRRRGPLDYLRAGLLLVVLAAVAVVLVRNWAEVGPQIRRVSPVALGLAGVAAVASPFFTMLGWRVLMADLGTRLDVPPAAGIFMVGQLGKYLPGSVWSVVAQAEIGARLGIPRRRSAVVGLVAMGMALVTAVMVGVPALPLLLRRGEGEWSVGLALVAAVVLLVALYPPVLNRGIALGLRLLRREPLEHELTAPAVVRSAGWTLFAWLMTGSTVWAVAADLAKPSAGAGIVALSSLSGFCLAAAVGMAAVLLPAGVGVRDGLLVVLLLAALSAPAAAAVVVISRFLTVVADVLWAGVAWWWARRHALLPG